MLLSQMKEMNKQVGIGTVAIIARNYEKSMKKKGELFEL